ncbi:DUF2163 domain-containing protein [Georhizobium profundi]|uniref:DUF2163 domain-containing protein n=1 Tax=Georhizobium profundi TaxID=2341112 RepID=A0A3Q8XRX0_9HYPH|nr:DUF2163 domain-containing protein [Georhizobium profundi]
MIGQGLKPRGAGWSGQAAVAQIFSSEDPESLRGPQFELAWCDELAKWRHPDETFDMLQFGLRLGQRPRQLVTTTPRAVPLLKRIMADPTTACVRIATQDNSANLAPGFLEAIEGRYGGTRLGRQELGGELIEDPAEGHLLKQVFDLGEVSRAGQAFRAELRSMAQQLDAVRGRVYGRRCDANLGDHRCRVTLDAPELTGMGTVTAVANGAKLRVIGIESFEDGWFRYGLATWQSGVNTGVSVAVLNHTRHDDGTEIELWSPMADAPQEGDTLQLTSGCDKTFKTCREKFANVLNFKGFPHLPGSDFAYGYAGENGLHDGAPVVP